MVRPAVMASAHRPWGPGRVAETVVAAPKWRQAVVVMCSRKAGREASGATRRPMIPQAGRSKPDRRSGRGDRRQPPTTWRSRDTSLSDDRAVGAAHDDVLDAGAVLADEVDPGFDREGHPLPQRLAVAGDDVRLLVALEPDPVTGPMEERVAVALGLDRIAGGGVDGLGGDPGPDRAGRGGLGALQDAEQVPEPLVGAVRRVAAGHPERARDVRAVAVDRAADVEDDRLAGRDDALRRLVMGRGGVRARADDREMGLLVAFGDEALADLARDVRLRSARPGGRRRSGRRRGPRRARPRSEGRSRRRPSRSGVLA